MESNGMRSEPMVPPVPASEEELRIIGKTLHSYFDSQSSKHLSTICAALLQNASFPNLSPSHRIAAFNALCGFVDLCSASQDKKTQSIARDPQLCSSLLRVYLQHYENSRAKSMKQLLTCVTKAIDRQPPGPGVHTRSASLQVLLTIVCDNDEEARAKPAFHVLAVLLHKQLVSAAEILANLNGERLGFGHPELSTRQLAEALLARLFTWVSQQDVAPIVGSFIPVFVQSFTKQDLSDDGKVVWIKPLAYFLDIASDQLLPFRFHILPGLFKLDRQGYWQFLQYIGVFAHLSTEQYWPLADDKYGSRPYSASLLFTVLQVGKELGFLELCDAAICPSISFTERTILVCDRLVGHLLGEQDLGVRLSGMSLLVSTKQQSLPLTKGVLDSLEAYIPQSLMEPDANFRSELLSHLRNLVERIKAVCSLLSRTILQHVKHDRLDDATSTEIELGKHKAFLHWLVRLISNELHPCTSYQRHVTALKILSILLGSGLDESVSENMLSKQAKFDLRWGFSIPILNSVVRRLLLDALLDPFEDVRQSSAAILKAVAKSSVHRHSQMKQALAVPREGDLYLYPLARSRAQRTMLLSGRIDHADGYARASDVYFGRLLAVATGHDADSSSSSTLSADSIALVDLLKDTVTQISSGLQIAKENIAVAVEQYPIHGLLTSMRYLLENALRTPQTTSLILQLYPTLCTDLEDMLRDIWACVKNTLCNDAPEGFLPDEADDESSMTTRDLLSYSWRALKESSLLLRTIIINLGEICNHSDRQRTLDSLGGLCFTQLADLRHRGAFSTVAQSFATVCLESRQSPIPEARSLNLKWYIATFELIKAQGSKITRRSAGIPAAMVGLLAAGLDFGQAVTDLEKVALTSTSGVDNDHIDLPQVHALNCLRAAFTSTKVVSRSEPHLVKAISIAAGALRSDLWPIRNCGLMLLRSLIDRLLGSHEAYDEVFIATTGSRLAYDRYPGLLELLRQLLDPVSGDWTGSRESAHESLFPALDLLRRAPPPSSSRGGFIPLILIAAGSSQWHIREAAARAFAALASETYVQLLDIPSTMNSGSDNMLHGRLLSLKFSIMASIQAVKSRSDGWYSLAKRVARYANSDVEPVASQGMAQQLKEISSFWTLKQSWTPILTKTFYDCINLVSTFLNKTQSHHDRSTPVSYLSSDIHPRNSNPSGRDAAIKEANETLKQAISNTNALSSAWQITSLGDASLRTSRALAHVLSLLVDSFDLPSEELDSVIARIRKALSQEHAESFEDVVRHVLKVSSEVENPSTVLHVFAGVLAGFISRGILGPPVTYKDVPGSVPSQNDKIRDVARSALSSILVQTHGESKWAFNVSSEAMSQLQLDRECWDSLSPSSIESLLELWGASLSAKYLAGKSWTQPLLDEGSLWTKYVSSALSDLNEFPLRYAAVQSLDGFKYASEDLSNVPDTLAISVILATYTALNDDDEDIRNVAAKVATRLLSTPDNPNTRVVSAAVASGKLCKLLATKYCELPRVTHEAMERMTGQRFRFSSSKTSTSTTEANARLQEYMKEDNTLFAIEKQNLYLDPVREADAWSTVLRQMSLSAIPSHAVEELSAWAMSGLQGLVTVAHTVEDGPLGWTSKPDIFALGVQVLNASSVLLDWQTRGIEVAQAGELRVLLADLVKDQDKSLLHELWVRRVEDILA